MSKLAVASGCVVWLAAVLYFETQWMERDYRPGGPATISEAWPKASAIPRDAKRAQVLLFVHPRCNCTKPALQLLERALVERTDSEVRDRRPDLRYDSSPDVGVDVRVVAFQPDSATADSEWAHPKTRLPVFADRGGVESRRFGVRTSGQVLIYDFDGALVWQGGLTASRGSVMEGSGYRTVAAFLQKPESGRRSISQALASVFGCSLRDGDWGERVQQFD